MFRTIKTVLLTAAFASLAAGAAHASVVVSLPGGTAIPIPSANLLTSGPQTLGPVTFSSNVVSKFGWTGSYSFGSNGSWSGEPPLIGLNAGSKGAGYATMTFTFDKPVSGFLAELNWNPGNVSNANSVIMQVFDSAGGTLEPFLMLSNNGAGNTATPGFYGFSRPTADIKSFSLSNGFVALRNLSYIAPVSGAVPEPATWAMMLLGMAGVGFSMRRKGKQTLSVRYT